MSLTLKDLENKVGSFFSGAGNDVQHAVAPIEQSASNFIHHVPQEAIHFGNMANTFGQHLQQAVGNQTNNAVVGLGQSPFGHIITGQQQLPQFNLTHYADHIQNPMLKFGANAGLGMADSLLNTPRNLLQAPINVARDVNAGDRNPKHYLSDVAPFAEGMLNIGTLGGGTVAKGVIKQGIKEGIKKGVIKGVVQGGKYGAAYGGLQGMESGRDIKTPEQYAGNLAKNTAIGAVSGAALGGITGGASGVKGEIGRLFPKATPQEQKAGANAFQLRNQMNGKYMVGKTTKKNVVQDWVRTEVGKKPGEPVYHSDLKKAIEKNMPQPGLSIKTLTEEQHNKTFGQLQQERQMPDLTTYENAINSGDTKTVQALAAKYPGDARFQIHNSLGNDEQSDTPKLLNIAPPQKISGFKQFWDRSRNVIASQGEAGQQLAQKLQDSRNFAERTAGMWVSRLPTVQKLSKDEFTNFVDVSEGNAHPINANVAQAAREWNKVRQGVHLQAKNAGLDIGKVEKYFPHTFDPSMFTDKNKYSEAVNHLVKTGQAKDALEAAQLLRHAQDVIRNRRQGNLEISRMVDLPGYEKTKDALFGYLESAANRIGQVTHFGANDEHALKLINKIANQGGDAATVKDLFDTAAGAKQYGELQGKISRGLRGYNSISKLGLGAITNAGQNVNTATVTGAFRTLFNAPKAAFSPEAKDFALKAGVTLDGVLRDLREGGGFEGKLGNLGAPGFNQVESFNRRLAAVAGRDYARSLAAKGDSKTLAKMGITLKGNKLDPNQEVIAARNIVERTQFKVDPQDLPGWTSSPWGKVISQFRSFSYNQSAFLQREIIQPALQGNMLPMARFLAVGIPTGMALQTGKNILRNRKDEENPIKRVQQGFSQVGGLGLAGDIVTGLAPMNGKYLDPNRATTMAISTIGGPTFGSLAEGYGALSNAVQGKPENLERFGVRQVPLIGGTLQNTLLPYKAQNGDVNRRFDPIPQAEASTGDTNTPQQDSGNFITNLFKGPAKDSSKITFTNGSGRKQTIDLTPPIKGEGIDAFTNKNWNVTKAIEVWKNKDNMSPEQEAQAYKKLGVDPQDVRYAYLASHNTDVSTQYITSKSPDHDTLMNNLTTGRVVGINGQQFASNAVVDAVYNQGLITKEEATALKKVKVDKNGKGLVKAGTGRVKKGKKLTFKSVSAPRTKSTPLKFSKPSAPKIKLSKSPTLKIKVAKASPKFKITKGKMKFSSKPSLTA
jgi:hypothetical protein